MKTTTLIARAAFRTPFTFAATAMLIRAFGSWALWIFPVIWTAHEYLRGYGPLAFPWTNLSLSHVYYRPLIQYADITASE